MIGLLLFGGLFVALIVVANPNIIPHIPKDEIISQVNVRKTIP